MGETKLNETSSRSHQILRLTIESSARKFGGNSSMLAANVNFVDLAGSERTSQTLATGARLKEGSHINRSLLTLGKVIRTLSKGRNAHIPYRDSKLTRILQNSLGGNARTAIICTMSPAHRHLEQSRNTLLFASCAKEVTTNAQVNVVMSDKLMVKQLRKELAKLENDLKNMSMAPSKDGDVAAVLREKELQIEKMDKEIKELSRQRDLAQSKAEELLYSTSKEQVLRPRHDVSDSPVTSDTSYHEHLVSVLATSESFQYLDEPGPFDLSSQRSELLENFDQFLPPNEPVFHPVGDSTPITFDDQSPLKTEERSVNKKKTEVSDPPQEKEEETLKKVDEKDYSVSAHEIEFEKEKEKEKENKIFSEAENHEERKPQHSDAEHDLLVQRINDLQRTIDILVNHSPLVIHSPCSTDSEMSSSRGSSFSRSRSCKAILTSTPTSSFDYEKVPIHYRDHSFGGFDRQKSLTQGSDDGVTIFNGKLSRFGLSTPSFRSAIPNEMEQDANISDISEASSFHVGTNGDAKHQSDKEVRYEMDGHAVKGDTETNDIKSDVTAQVMQVSDCMSEGVVSTMQSPLNWFEEFESQRIKIIELWNACHIPLVHRTYFYLLFKVDPSDKIYMEVELRRLSFIKSRFDQCQKIAMDGQVFTPSSSIRALTQEREMLVKQMYKQIPSHERESLFKKWGIAINSKERRLQLARQLWTDTKDMQHIRESVDLVAKLVGFVDDGQVPKEMFVGPSVVSKSLNRRSYSWIAGL